MSIQEDVLERALKLAQQAEVYYVESTETPARFQANRLKELQTVHTRGMALRLIKNGRIGFASTTNVEDLDGLVQRAVEVASFGAIARFDFPGHGQYPSVEVFDPAVERVSVDDLVQFGQRLIDALVAEHPDVLCEGTVEKGIASTAIMNSSGLSVTSSQSEFGVGLEGTVVQDTDMLFVYDELSSCRPITDASPVLDHLGRQLEQARIVAPSVSGALPVIFTPHAIAGGFLWPLASAFNGKSVLLGTSPLAGRLGKRIVHETFSLWDDPTIPFIPGSGASDDEGMPSRRTPLIERGVVHSFVYDLQTAGQAGAQSTGNAARSLGAMPAPATSVLIIGPGTGSLDDMVRDIKEGILVEGLLGAGQGNMLAGDFNANVLLGYRIRNGKVVGRVKDTVVAGNVYDALSNLAGVGRDSRWVGGRVCTPPLYCNGISIASQG